MFKKQKFLKKSKFKIRNFKTNYCREFPCASNAKNRNVVSSKLEKLLNVEYSNLEIYRTPGNSMLSYSWVRSICPHSHRCIIYHISSYTDTWNVCEYLYVCSYVCIYIPYGIAWLARKIIVHSILLV